MSHKMPDQYRDYLCEYPFEGDWWCFKITAKSNEEALARIKQMPWAVVKGEHMATIQVSPRVGWRRWLFGAQ
jgi:hypothetical protein